MIYPETLENSKIISLLSEDLTLKISDFYNLKELNKINLSKEEFITVNQ